MLATLLMPHTFTSTPFWHDHIHSEANYEMKIINQSTQTATHEETHSNTKELLSLKNTFTPLSDYPPLPKRKYYRGNAANSARIIDGLPKINEVTLVQRPSKLDTLDNNLSDGETNSIKTLKRELPTIPEEEEGQTEGGTTESEGSAQVLKVHRWV